MTVISNAALIRSLLEQIPAGGEVNAESFQGDRDQVLFGLREMINLELITGQFEYGKARDPVGPLLSSAAAIRLTRRGLSLK